MPDGPPPARVASRLGRGSGALGLLLTALLLFARTPGPALAEEARLVLRLAPERIKQGGVTVLRTESSTPIRSLRVQVGDRPILTASPEGQTPQSLLIGVDLEQPPGTVLVHAEAVDGSGRVLRGQAPLLILDARFPVQRLSAPRPFVELDAASLERVDREKAVLDRLWETLTPERFWRGPFRVPLEGAGPGAGFGERRIINGEPRSPHTGTDYSAPAGAPVLAANAGTVALVADHFFAGRLVILDHGLGLYTMYFHLQESLVQPGRRMERGQPIARVGSTGRATGPHLHWGARLQGARIDPRELLHMPSLD